MPQEGFLIISDITGYSTYLHESELEHAQDSLTDLLNVLIEYTRSPLVISKLEGDAVFSYAPSGGFLHGQTMLEMIETTYAAFRKALDLMVINTSCSCNACRNLPNLDLKIFVHYGVFSIHKMGDFRELIGKDVILVHRLLKNKISEETGLKAYAAYCQAVIDVLNMEELVGNMILHRESLANIGEVRLYVQDMSRVWDRRKDELRVTVDPGDAADVFEFEFPIPPPLLWEYLTKPEYRKIMKDADSMSLSGQTDGRIGEGAVYICAHGNNKSLHTVLDWEPFEQYTTLEDPGPPINLVFTNTYRLTPTEDGSRLQVCSARPTGPKSRVVVFYLLFFLLFRSGILPHPSQKGVNALTAKIEGDLAATRTVIAPKIIFGNELVSQAAAESLAEIAAPAP